MTQATISRDIRELGLVKSHDSLGRMLYVLPNREQRTDPRDTLEALLRQFGRRADLRAEHRRRPVRDRLGPRDSPRLDRLEHPLVLGTLAGDDTCLLVARDAKGARRLAKELVAAIG